MSNSSTVVMVPISREMLDLPAEYLKQRLTVLVDSVPPQSTTDQAAR